MPRRSNCPNNQISWEWEWIKNKKNKNRLPPSPSFTSLNYFLFIFLFHFAESKGNVCSSCRTINLSTLGAYFCPVKLDTLVVLVYHSLALWPTIQPPFNLQCCFACQAFLFYSPPNSRRSNSKYLNVDFSLKGNFVIVAPIFWCYWYLAVYVMNIQLFNGWFGQSMFFSCSFLSVTSIVVFS